MNNTYSKCSVKCEKYESCSRYSEKAEEEQGYLVQFDQVKNTENNFTCYIQNNNIVPDTK
jgi:hypothetical protein